MNIYLPFFGIFIIFIIWSTYEMRRSKELQNKQSEDFWNRENDANNVRRQSLDNLDYICVESSCIPELCVNNPDVTAITDRIMAMSREKILNLTGLTNTELKLTYGPANLTFLTDCDERFTTLCRLLNSLGETLVQNGYSDEAVMVYEYAISIGSDVSSCYTALASLYINAGTPDKIHELINQAETLNSLSGRSIVSRLKELI